jgi:hypothetical protein
MQEVAVAVGKLQASAKETPLSTSTKNPGLILETRIRNPTLL